MKAEPSPLIPRKHSENLELSTVCAVLLDRLLWQMLGIYHNT